MKIGDVQVLYDTEIARQPFLSLTIPCSRCSRPCEFGKAYVLYRIEGGKLVSADAVCAACAAKDNSEDRIPLLHAVVNGVGLLYKHTRSQPKV